MLINLQNVTLAFEGPALLDCINLSIDKKDRLCLLGRNGIGKSTLLKIISGVHHPDHGNVIIDKEVKISYLQQEIPNISSGTVKEVVASAYFEDRNTFLDNMINVTSLKDVLEEKHLLLIEKAISQLNLISDAPVKALSGGLQRRVQIAKALATDPDLLLLDEPTNHLDIESITLLENLLHHFHGAILFVTHDRTFIQKMANVILELDRGELSKYECSYDKYLEQKETKLEVEEKQWKNFNKKLDQEEIWIRKGIKARRTRNEGRVRHLLEMREQKRNRRVQTGTAQMRIQNGELSGRLIADVKQIDFSYNENIIIRNFSTRIMRGDKIGLVGPNGIGKTTLIKLLTGELTPHTGSVSLGTNLNISYFDQLRSELDENKTVKQNLTDDNLDQVTINGNSKHVYAYLQDFLFTRERSQSFVKELSGGERNRLLLAKIFTKPANLLILDEPTNDLDIETLELLEELLNDYEGTLLLVTHDRSFLNNVVTSIIEFKGAGELNEYVGGYDDLLLQKKQEQIQRPYSKNESIEDTRIRTRTRKLTYKERTELDKLPALVESLEIEQQELNNELADPSFYKDNPTKVKEYISRLDELKNKLEELYIRWSELEELG